MHGDYGGNFARTAALIGENGVATLGQKRVAVFGLGGVGGHVCEALARAGIGTLHLFDGDIVAKTNLNRQIVALHSTIGQFKCDVMAKRILDINPSCQALAFNVFYTPQNAQQYPLNSYNYVVDAVDMVSAKIEIIIRAKMANVPVISCMGAGNKLHPEGFCVDDISKTSVCPLARAMRSQLKKRGIEKVQVVYSKELPIAPQKKMQNPNDGNALYQKQNAPGSVSFVPAAAGMVLAGAVVRQLLWPV